MKTRIAVNYYYYYYSLTVPSYDSKEKALVVYTKAGKVNNR